MSRGTDAAASQRVSERAIEAQLLSRRTEYAASISKYVLWPAAATTVLCAVLWAFSRQYTQLLWSAVCLVPVVASQIDRMPVEQQLVATCLDRSETCPHDLSVHAQPICP